MSQEGEFYSLEAIEWLLEPIDHPDLDIHRVAGLVTWNNFSAKGYEDDPPDEAVAREFHRWTRESLAYVESYARKSFAKQGYRYLDELEKDLATLQLAHSYADASIEVARLKVTDHREWLRENPYRSPSGLTLEQIEGEMTEIAQAHPGWASFVGFDPRATPPSPEEAARWNARFGTDNPKTAAADREAEPFIARWLFLEFERTSCVCSDSLDYEVTERFDFLLDLEFALRKCGAKKVICFRVINQASEQRPDVDAPSVTREVEDVGTMIIALTDTRSRQFVNYIKGLKKPATGARGIAWGKVYDQYLADRRRFRCPVETDLPSPGALDKQYDRAYEFIKDKSSGKTDKLSSAT